MKWIAAGLLCFWSVPMQAQEPRLILPVGHTSSISSAAFSPNGKQVVTASWDNTAKLWEAPGGKLLQELKKHSASLTSAAFSSNGKFIVTTSKDNTAILWDAASGRSLHVLRGHTDWLTGAAFSPDNTVVATCSWDHTARLWDVETGRLLHILSGHRGPVNKVGFNSDGKFLITASMDSTARVWGASSGKPVSTLQGHAGGVNDVVFSPDNRFAATASKDGTARQWQWATGKPGFTLKGHRAAVLTVSYNRSSTSILTSSSDGTAVNWSAATGKKTHSFPGSGGPLAGAIFSRDGSSVATLGNDGRASIWSASKGTLISNPEGHDGPITAAMFSPDGRFLLTSSMDNTAKIWSAGDGAMLGSLHGYTSVVTSVNFSPDGKYMVTSSWDNTAKIWDAADGKLLSELSGHTDWLNGAVFSNDGRYVVTASNDNTAKVWTVPGGKMVWDLKGHTDWVSSAVFSPDNTRIVTTSWDNTAMIFNMSDGKMIHRLEGHTAMVKSAAFNADGELLLTAGWDNTVKLWDVLPGIQVRTYEGHTDKVRSAVFNRDGSRIVTSSWDSTARIWNTASGVCEKILSGHSGSLNAALLSPDEQLILTTSMDHTGKIWDAASGELLHTLSGHSSAVNSAAFRPDGRSIVMASWDNSATIWNTSGKLTHRLTGHTGSLKSAIYSPDGKTIVTTSEDNTLRRWNASNGDFMYSFFAVGSSDYLAIDKFGHYDGTGAARERLYYVCGNEIIDLEQFKDLNWEPGLVGKLTGANPEPITAGKQNGIDICNYAPLVEETGVRNGQYSFAIFPRRGGVGEVQVFVNGKLTNRYDPSSLRNAGGKLILEVGEENLKKYFLSSADNTVTVKATTEAGLAMSRGSSIISSTPRKTAVNPNLYLVAVGISQYKNESLRLRYADKDASDFVSALTASAKKLLNTDQRQHVFTYLLNTEPHNPRWPLKSGIEKLIDSIAVKARPDDIIVLFFAGHGVLQTGQKNFLLLTAEASGTDMQGIEEQAAISTSELMEWLRKIRANKQLLILDACNSGRVVEQFQGAATARDIPADQQRALENLKDKTGTFILSASASGQAAYETSIYGQGLLTYSLLSGIKLGGGLRDNRFLDVTRWFNHACENVKAMAKEIGGRQDPQIIGNASFEIGLVDQEVVDNINLPTKKKLLRKSVFIGDEETLNDDLDISYLVDAELKTVSANGKDNPFVFIGDNPMLDAYTIRGRYTRKGNAIKYSVIVFRGQKERMHQFEINGTVEGKEESIKKIVETVRLAVKQETKQKTPDLNR